MTELVKGLQLSYSYDQGLRVLSGVDIQVNTGELLAVLGPNGAGKSTLLKLLAGLLHTDEGTILVEGSPIKDWKSNERAQRIAVVPQSLGALPEVTVEVFVGYGRYAHSSFLRRPSQDDRQAIEHALEATDMASFGARPLAELSGGQRQRALIARALAQEARLLLVDEPTSALDPEHQVQIFELLARLCRTGRGVVVVTHELNLASQFASRAILLDGGRVAAEGDLEEILRPEVLEPVYGQHLRYGRMSAPWTGGERPFVLPWLKPESGA